MKTPFSKNKSREKSPVEQSASNIVDIVPPVHGSQGVFINPSEKQAGKSPSSSNKKNTALDKYSDAGPTASGDRENAWVFLFPAMNAQDGGYLAQLRFFEMANSLANAATESRIINHASIATYENKEADFLWLDNILKTPAHSDKRVYCIHYGPHINSLLKKLKGRRVVYFAHSVGWSIKLPPEATVVSVSKHCLGYWSKKNPSNAQYYLPNVIDDKFVLPLPLQDYSLPKRTHDILVIKRKMSSYLLEDLVPQLQGFLRVKVVENWNPAIEEDMKSSKIFLYDSSSYWKKHKATEGFGLPPLEAMACGCTVFSSLNDGLADFLDPLVNCNQLHPGNVQRDIENIFDCIREWQEPAKAHAVVDNYRRRTILQRFSAIATQINKQHSPH